MTTADRRPMTSYDRWMYRLMNRREAAPFHATAARRRAVVCAHIALTAAGVAVWLLAVVGDQRWALWTMLGLLLPWCFSTGVINSSTRGLLELRVRALDERQRAEKNRVAALAHRAMLWVLLAATVGSGAAALAGVKIEGLVFSVLFTVFVVHWLTPLWVAGLTVRDEPEFDDDPVEVAAGTGAA
ncbi:hypothetical protein [Streptomyces alboniger]|uniref:Uncharacterized protein n=1 Tax=Streptomyces alboniger TaxID=132473 RepID=A0A5J6HMU2_STRAD|nr:hypothetical protein [Streptomyces alboniger]QEV19751.1 hypothetical protein CP975_21590 [Streptomyces alboniger]